jgi:hypothetical protein
MHRRTTWTTVGIALSWMYASTPAGGAAQEPRPAAVQQIDLAERLSAGKLRVVNREVTPIQGTRGVHLSERPGTGIAWVEGSEFGQGVIELDVRGRDVFQRSFVGVAFHRRDDNTYEAVYLRPFNFRSTDPIRHMHAVQYIAVPDYNFQKLRADFPEEFENPVDPSVDPAAWVRLRIVVKGQAVQIYVGQAASPTLEVRKLGTLDRGMVGLWADNGSDGDFANLRITPIK